MTTYFAPRNWEPFVYQRLNELIDEFKQGKEVPEEERNYVVFDMDNTSIIGDVEDNTMMFMLEHLLYKLTPEAFLNILISEPFALDSQIPEQTFTVYDLAHDIYEAYQWLWNNYITQPVEERAALESIKSTKYFISFRAKLRYYYQIVNKIYVREAGKAWLTYWFSGYTPEELVHLTREMLDWAQKLQPELRIYQTHSDCAGQTGQIESSFKSGLAVPPELRDIYDAFQTNGIITYVVSASPIDVVRTAAVEIFQIPYHQVIGMFYQVNSDGRIESIMEMERDITKREGKTSAILNVLMPKHLNKEPLALFGDSMGDYHMMRNFEDVKLNVLFNCLSLDDTQLLIQEAQQLYSTKDANIVIQGRDENLLQLRPSPETIALGSSESRLYAKKQ